MTDPSDDVIRAMVVTAHRHDPDQAEFDILAGLGEVLRRASSPTPSTATPAPAKRIADDRAVEVDELHELAPVAGARGRRVEAVRRATAGGSDPVGASLNRPTGHRTVTKTTDPDQSVPHPGRRATFYTRLTPAEHQGLRAVGVVRNYQHGEYVFLQGDEGDRVLVVRSGHAKIVATDGDSRNMLLGVAVAGDLLGELSFLNGGGRSASVIALGPLSVLSIGFAQFNTLLNRYPRMATEVARAVSDKLRSADRRRLEFNFPVVTRVARVLAEMVTTPAIEDSGDADDSFETGIAVAMTQRELGQLVGAAEVSVHKALRRLSAQGLLTPRHGRIVITRPDELRRAAGA